jgi:hypothetical protein
LRCSPGRAALIFGLAALLFAGFAAAGADAKKKKKKKAPATTKEASLPLLPSSVQSATANCGKKTHMVGGGLLVAPGYSANGTLSARSSTPTTRPAR